LASLSITVTNEGTEMMQQQENNNDDDKANECFSYITTSVNADAQSSPTTTCDMEGNLSTLQQFDYITVIRGTMTTSAAYIIDLRVGARR